MAWCARCCPRAHADADADDRDRDPGHASEQHRRSDADAGAGDACDAGNPRNKVCLRPGHSLMDWIRLGAGGRVDLTGVGGRVLDVTPQQLAQHALPGDAWLALRGRVYNVTHYMDFHPGGPDELLRGAGRDATALFNQVHAWVNYESILQKCVVGRLRRDSEGAGAGEDLQTALRDAMRLRGPPPPLSAPASPSASTSSNHLALPSPASPPPLPSPKVPAPAPAPATAPAPASPAAPPPPTPAADAPRMDWFQQSGSLSLVWYASCTRPAWPGARVRLRGSRDLRVALLLPPDADGDADAPGRPQRRVAFRLRLRAALAWPPAVQRSSGKLQVTFRKQRPGVWASLEQPEEQSACEEAEEEEGAEAEGGGGRFACVRVVASHALTPRVRLLLLRGQAEEQATAGADAEEEQTERILDVPGVGQHVVVSAMLQGVEVRRRYTPVPAFLHASFAPSDWAADCLCLMVKGYPDGLLSGHLTALRAGAPLRVSEPQGAFAPRRLARATRLALLAAGTGLTPMLGVVGWATRLPANAQPDHVLLVNFNRTAEDRMWAEQLALVAEESKGRFQVEHVLSDAEPDWTGRRGHIDLPLLQELLAPPGPGVFVSACGPPGFVEASHRFLEELGYPEDQYHIFDG